MTCYVACETMNDTTQAIQAPQTPTSTPKAIDWKLVRDLYLQEVPHKDISAQTGASLGAIRCRAYRHGWKDDARNDLIANPPPIKDLVEEWQLNMSLAMIAGSRFWANWDESVNSGKDARDWELAKQAHVQSGRMLFGLDQQTGARPSAWAAGAAVGPVIDVTPVIQDKPAS
jgi:hypothetical protein